MLTVDLVRARRRDGELQLITLSGPARERAAALAQRYIDVAKASVGRTRGELDEAWGAIAVHARDRKVSAGLRKLLADRCEFEVEDGADPAALRQQVFLAAAATRRELDVGARFDREAILARVGAERGLDAAEVERLLYVDLRSAHRLLSFRPTNGAALVDDYTLAQAQAVLIRAESVSVEIRCATPGAYRALFHKLKFRGLLYTVHPLDDGGYRLDIDGPFSMFRASTKYGVALALALPAVRACDEWSLQAQVLWGARRDRLEFRTAGKRRPQKLEKASDKANDEASDEASDKASDKANDDTAGADANAKATDANVRLPDTVAKLLDQFERRDTAWQAAPSTDILHLPGVGVCVPDLVFTHAETGLCVYLEVMGFWSRDAVWRRVELVEAGLPERILFCVSSRLRVSEAVLPDELPGALYVYKGAISARIVHERLDRLAGLP